MALLAATVAQSVIEECDDTFGDCILVCRRRFEHTTSVILGKVLIYVQLLDTVSTCVEPMTNDEWTHVLCDAK